jgi:hypothetical protein
MSTAAEWRLRQGDTVPNPDPGYATVYSRPDDTVWVRFNDGSEFPALIGNTAKKQSFTLTPTDISNGYVDLAFTAIADSLDLVFNGLLQGEGVEYTLAPSGGGVTRLTFAGALASGDGALISGDVINVKYQH